jgi:5'(3')-deoxyribonucleotidase
VTPIVLLDCDGPLADFVGACAAELSRYGVTRRLEDVTKFNLEAAWGLTQAQKNILTNAYRRRGFCEEITPQPGAVDAVKRLHKVADVFCVTTPMWSGPTWQHERVNWLREHFDIDRNHVVLTGAKHLVHGDVFVDDKAEAVSEWRTHRGGLGILWAMPHNHDVWHSGEWRGARTSDWEHVIGCTEGIARG